MADQVVYISKVRIERIKGPFRRAYLPVESEPIHFGTHSEVAQYYGHDPTVHSFHAAHCPVARTIGKCVAISTSFEIEDA